MRKVERALRVILLVLAVPAFIGLGLNQWGSFINKGNELKVLTAMESKLNNLGNPEQEQAVADCMQYGTHHAIIVEGKTYCFLVQGERIASLEYLTKNLDPQEIP